MRVERLIAAGGFGRVESVRLDDGTLAARKTYSPKSDTLAVSDPEKLRQRFAREVRVQSSLPDSLFIPVLLSDLNCAEPWYVMPLAEKNYWDQIKENKRLGKETTSGLADILNSLEELHRLQYVHRDLKPENVLLHNGTWKLSDFGLVRPLDSKTTQLTTNSTWGSRDYCAPEQAVAFKGAAPAADIYAFGCILHDIYGNTARIPFARHSAPDAVGVVIEKCTEISPHKRFKTVGALRDALFSISENPKPPSNVEASSFIKKLEVGTTWSRPEIDSFVRFIEGHSETENLTAIWTALDLNALADITRNDLDLWKPLALALCDWIVSEDFGFDFCDVLANRLKPIWEKGDFECRAAVALASASLANRHNRFYVMRLVMKLCGPELEDALAERIAIEIRASAVEADFRACAERLGRSYSQFHRAIAGSLT